jgi:membrane dipeptidase
MRALFALLAPVVLMAQADPRTARLHKDAYVFDAHVHVINRQFHHGGNLGDRLKDGDFDLVRAREGGLDALFFSLFVSEDYYPQRLETKHTLRLVELALQQLERHKDQIELARNADDLERIRKAGKVGAVLDLEGGFDLDGDLGVLRSLHRLGLRSLQLSAHNWTNNLADSCCAPAKNKGLSERGRALIREMNRLGMVINISHASDEAIAQALEVSTDPLIATHHGLRSVVNIPRNMPDDLLKKLAAKGGLIGFQIGSTFHSQKAFDWQAKNQGKPFWDRSDVHQENKPQSLAQIDAKVANGWPMGRAPIPPDLRITIDDYLAVVEKAIALVGEDHVALGTDFDGGPVPPTAIRDVRDLPLLTEAMLKRGWSEERICKFLGGNLLRVFRQITSKK